MPANQHSRKRKQPASPSPTNNRPSPYHPTNDVQRNTNRGGGAGRGRRQSSISSPTPQHHAPAQSPQAPPPPPRNPSRLNVTTNSAPISASTPLAEDPDISLDSPPPSPKKDLFCWEYITDDVAQDWHTTGSQEFKQKLTDLVVGGKENSLEISVALQEIIKAAVDSRLDATDVGHFLSSVVQENGGEEGLLARILIEAVFVFEPLESGKDTPPRLVTLLHQLHPHPISEKALALRLDDKTLLALGFVTHMFSKKAIRLTTSLVYKQRKHNLLREETEGFSKLITEFFTASYSAAPLEVVGRTGERVKGLIGAFELDPSRVLDILLDTAACTVVSNARFFVRLLRISAWWPQQLQGAVDEDIPKGRDDIRVDKEKEKERSDGEFFDKLSSKGISAFFEKFDNPKGNRVAAQLLGFKFRYYQRDDVREQTPENLLVLSALLIKIGFIDLADLYPHLAPYDDAGMNEILDAWRTKLEEKTRGSRRNALMMAGALADDTAPPPRPSKPSNSDEKKPVEEPKKEEEPRPKKDDNQKIVLLKYLLAMGALPEALFILGKYPWLPGPSEDITEHLGRVIMQAIDGVYQPLRITTPAIGSKKLAAATTTGKTGGVELFDQPRRKPMVTFTVSNLKLKTGDIEYRFFWEEWKDGVPICRNPADVVLLMKTLGKVLGVRIGRDAGVLTRVCRIGRSVLKSDTCTQAERDSWIELARSLLVPAVSLTDGNQGVVNEVWRLLECFPMKTRYTLYGEWVSVMNKRHPELKAKVTAVEKETKDLLKRISKTNVRQMARQLAKVATSNPVTVMQVVLGQVEGYDNLIECVVDAARYFTPLGFDAVGFCVLNSMSNEGKQRVQADGMLTSRWLQSLSVFCGKIYTRYHKEMDPGPILEYVARQLKRNHSVELIVLQHIVQSMAGINPESNLNDAQLQGLAGGDLLRKQVLKAFRDKRAEDTPETMKTLTHTLSSQNLAAELLVLIAQERQTCIFRLEDDSAPLKVLANLFDEIHLVLSQYLDVLKMGLTPDQYDQAIPDVIALCSKFGIEPAVSWWVSRLGIRSRMKKLESPDSEDAEMKDATPAATSESTETPTPTPTPTPVPGPTPDKKTPWNPVLAKIMEDIKPVLPEQVWTKLSVSFYVTFWQLEIYDIFVPMDAYQAENNRVNVAIRALDLDRSDLSVPGQQRKRERREELLSLNSSLQAELKFHIKENGLIRKRLNTEKEHWFKEDNINQRDITDTFIQHCLFPRVMLSPNDATFCSKFIREVHRMGTPKFHTVGVYDAIFGKGLSTVIFICTQREAENFGRFLKECLSDLHGWHADRALYEREAYGQQRGLVGFVVKGQLFDWEDFRKILYKWHKALTVAVKNCLSSKEYMHIRNAIVILKHVAEFFPCIDWIGRIVVEKVELLVKSEKREDLKIAAMTLLGMLKRRADDWVVISAFQKIDAPTPAGVPRPTNSPTPAHAALNTAGNTRPSSPVPGQQQQQQQARPLSAVATEFKPDSAITAPKATPTSAPSRAPSSFAALPSKPEIGDKEDGEIDDSRNRRPLLPQNSLPQRPQLSQMDQRKPGTPTRDSPHHLQDSGRGSGSRAPTPRRDEQRLNNDVRRQSERNELNRTPVQPRGPISQSQHQLPERPDMPRQSTLERRDAVRDLPRNDTRGRPDGRLPEKPIERRHSPRRDGRDMRDLRDRHDQDPRGSMGRERDFNRPMIPQAWEDRNQRMDERMLDQPEGPRTVQSGARVLQQIIESEERRRDDRDGRRSRTDRHDPTSQQTGRLNDYTMDRLERVDRTDQFDHRIPERKPEPIPARLTNEPGLSRHHSLEDLHAPRTPPVGPRGRVFERDRGGPTTQQQQKERELFTSSQAVNQMRAPPSAPSHPSDQFRDTRHPIPGSFHHQDPNHGRLNPPSDMNIPKGPRDRNIPQYGPHSARGSMSIRGASAAAAAAAQAAGSQPSVPQQSQPPAASTPHRQQPTSVVVDTSVRKSDMPPPSTERMSQSAPTTPTVDTAGIHPDRLKALGVDTALPQRPTQTSSASATSSPVTSHPPRGPREDPSTPQQTSPPTGPARREGPGVDEERNRRRRIQNVQSQLAREEERNRSSSRRNGSTSTPVQPAQVLAPDRRMSTSESRRSSAVTTPTAEVPPPVVERSSRHHRSDRGDRSERDRRIVDTERDRERDRDRDRDRKSDRGEREHRRERERGRERSGRGEKHPRDSTSEKERRDSGREREGREREEKRRRRGGEWGGGGSV